MKTTTFRLTTCATALVALLACASVSAQTSTGVIDKRQQRLDSRIAKGEASGKLSAQEAARLKARQAKIDGMKQSAKADGKVTAAERKTILAQQNKQSRHVYRQKNDGNKR